MTFMDVTLQAIDGFGKVLDSIHVFWVDGWSLKELLGERMRPVDPMPAWYCHLDREEAQEIFENNPCQGSNKPVEFNERMAKVMQTGKSHIIRIEEW